MSIQQINNGDLGSKARATINSTARAVQMASGGKVAVVDFFGDSISSAGLDVLGGVWQAAAGYWAPGLNIQIRSGYGVGGTVSSHILTNQLPLFEASIAGGAPLPDIVAIQTHSNDSITTAANAATFAQNQITFANTVLAMGVPLVFICSALPKNNDAVQAARMAINSILQRYADVTPGVIFFDWFSLSVNPDNLSTGNALWNPIPALQGYSSDGIHPTVNACFAAGRLIAEALDSVVGRVAPRRMLNARYASTNADTRAHNMLGPEGNFLGTGGQLDGVDNAGVAGTANTVNNRWQITGVAGVTIVPSIVTDAFGVRKQRLVFSGMPSANGSIILRYFHNFLPVAQGVFAAQAVLDFTDIAGLNGFAMNAGAQIQSGLQNTTGVPGSIPTHSGRWFLRGLRAPAVRASSGGSLTYDISFNVRNGVPLTGAVEVSQCAWYQISETL